MSKTIIKVKRDNSLIRERSLKHSAKGSSWKNHKYIKKVGDKYIYADTKNGESEGDGNTTSSGENTTGEIDTSKEGQTAEGQNQEEFDLEAMANKVIRGEFGNGADRKELLGDAYAEIQKRVNEILLGGGKTKSIDEKKVDDGKKIADKLLGTTAGTSKKVKMTK